MKVNTTYYAETLNRYNVLSNICNNPSFINNLQQMLICAQIGFGDIDDLKLKCKLARKKYIKIIQQAIDTQPFGKGVEGLLKEFSTFSKLCILNLEQVYNSKFRKQTNQIGSDV